MYLIYIKLYENVLALSRIQTDYHIFCFVADMRTQNQLPDCDKHNNKEKLWKQKQNEKIRYLRYRIFSWLIIGLF